MTALFLTATGTDIGKTFVAERMIRDSRRQGRTVRALKPVASGFDPAAPAASDTGRLLAALGEPLTAAALDAVSPWRYAAPLSPDMAAAAEGRRVPVDEVVAFCRRAVAEAESDGAELLIEGIGGVMVPLDARRTVADWIAALGIPAVLVCGTYLGTLSHTLSAIEVLRARRIALARVVVNESPEGAVSPAATAAALAPRIAPVAVTVQVRE